MYLIKYVNTKILNISSYIILHCFIEQHHFKFWKAHSQKVFIVLVNIVLPIIVCHSLKKISTCGNLMPVLNTYSTYLLYLNKSVTFAIHAIQQTVFGLLLSWVSKPLNNITRCLRILIFDYCFSELFTQSDSWKYWINTIIDMFK